MAFSTSGFVKESMEGEDFMLEVVFSGVFALILLGFAILGLQIPNKSNPADFIEASGFPVIFAGLALVLLIWDIFVQYQAIKMAGKRETSNGLDIKQAPKVAVIITMTIVYILLVKTLGFIILSFIFMLIAINLLGSKKQWINVLFSFLTIVMLVLFFGKFFGISLPRGIGILKELSFYLY